MALPAPRRGADLGLRPYRAERTQRRRWDHGDLDRDPRRRGRPDRRAGSLAAANGLRIRRLWRARRAIRRPAAAVRADALPVWAARPQPRPLRLLLRAA